MKKLMKLLVAGTVVVMLSMVSVGVRADDSIVSEESGPFRKLGRGVVNVGFGVLEIPMNIYDVNEVDGGLAAITYGTFRGIGCFVAREVVGAVEIVTFLVPLPGTLDEPREGGWGYGPIMRPEWVVGPDHDIYNIIYQDLPVD